VGFLIFPPLFTARSFSQVSPPIGGAFPQNRNGDGSGIQD
jgi:hypothetical protein